MEKLTPKKRLLVMREHLLKHPSGLTERERAAMLGWSPSTVHKYLQLARRSKLRVVEGTPERREGISTAERADRMLRSVEELYYEARAEGDRLGALSAVDKFARLVDALRKLGGAKGPDVAALVRAKSRPLASGDD